MAQDGPVVSEGPVTVLGVGNTLLSDEGWGVALARRLAAWESPSLRVLDGGTIGLALMPLLEGTSGLIFLDAARLDAPPGTVRVLEGAELDAFAAAAPLSPHDVGLRDLLDGLRLVGSLPERRALVAAAPERLGLGEALSPALDSALATGEDRVRKILERWLPG